MALLYFLALSTLVITVAADSMRVEFQLTKLENPEGILYNGKKCDIGSKCDPRLSGYVDTDKPLNAWPGSKPVSQFTKIFESDDQDSASVNKIVSRDVCVGSSFNKGNLRVDLVDKDVTTTEQIEQFECMSGRDVRIREAAAVWSTEKPCESKFNPNKVKLMYKWRAFNVPDRECGRPVGSSKRV
ncbi:hypothetical protein BV898_09025 [Hypsibius exemplaris]|uniref:Secreted protein n=1 Tax=Hypsibius exemplaris TaxID=2072580 RepID=A0A1W0WP03_HYPEX|nr:hypothetical protein BV898_09025 [Hypsibius exemplaris]